MEEVLVLNLIITGIPSILQTLSAMKNMWESFKPYYNWNTFNTCSDYFVNVWVVNDVVLNLIITGIPSIRSQYDYLISYP